MIWQEKPDIYGSSNELQASDYNAKVSSELKLVK